MLSARPTAPGSSLVYDFSRVDPERANRAREQAARIARTAEGVQLGARARQAKECTDAYAAGQQLGEQQGYTGGVHVGLWLGFVCGVIVTGILLAFAIKLGQYVGQFGSLFS